MEKLLTFRPWFIRAVAGLVLALSVISRFALEGYSPNASKWAFYVLLGIACFLVGLTIKPAR